MAVSAVANKIIGELTGVFGQGTSLLSSKLLTIGIEHEWFLFQSPEHPATFEMSQEFLQVLATLPGWEEYDSTNDELGHVIRRVSKQLSRTRYTNVKYEYAPHLLEVAFGYFENLNDLGREVELVWENLQTVAKVVGATIVSKPIIPRPNVSIADQIRVNPDSLILSESRRDLFKKRREAVNDETVDFPAHIAASQVQIGGLNWWNHSEIVGRLYGLEPLLQSFSYKLISKSHEEALKISSARWNAYQSVFSGMRLLGFPHLNEWTRENWIDALCESQPLNLLSSTKTPEFSRYRDLQIIRPKITGTLEFRADPAMASPEQILSLAALRLGQCLLAVRPVESVKRIIMPFSVAYHRWWESTRSLDLTNPDSTRLLELISLALMARGFAEEKLLNGGVEL